MQGKRKERTLRIPEVEVAETQGRVRTGEKEGRGRHREEDAGQERHKEARHWDKAYLDRGKGSKKNH